MNKDTMHLGELLVFKGVISQEQLQQAVDMQCEGCRGALLGDILCDRCGASRDAIEAVFLQNVLLPVANDVFFRKAEAMIKEELAGEYAVRWAMMRPTECIRHARESQRMLWHEGALEMEPSQYQDTLEVSGFLTVACCGGKELEAPMHFFYDIRKKTLEAPEKQLEELREAFRSLRPHS